MLSKGHAYEKAAEKFLLQQGLSLKSRNYHTKRGEIDLIMKHGNTLVFIEVRYRKYQHFGSAEETITRAKQEKIIFSAKHYLAKYNLWDLPVRFDVIAFTHNKLEQLELNWLKNAFN